jgi:hypothetical protein
MVIDYLRLSRLSRHTPAAHRSETGGYLSLAKSLLANCDGLSAKTDMEGVVFEMVIWWRKWYSESPFQASLQQRNS